MGTANSTPVDDPGSPAPDVPADVVEFRNAQQIEYGTYVATTDIYVGTALAYTEGMSVPVSNVKAHGYDKMKLVRKV